MRYQLSHLAEQDLQDIWSYVAGDSSPERADRLLDAIGDGFERLAELPRIGRRRPEFGTGVRSVVVENYVIYYREEDLVIARVLHGNRDQKAAWQESAEGDGPES